MQVQNWQGKQWKFVACVEMMNPRQVPNLLFISTLLTCLYTFIDHLIRGTDCPMNDLAFHFSPPEVLFHSPSVCSIYLYLYSSLFSRVFSRSKSLPDSRLNISSIQLKTCSLASYFLHYVLCYNNDTIFCFWRMLSISKYIGALVMLVESPQNSTDKTLFPRTRGLK